MTDNSPLRTPTQQADFDHFLIKEIRTGLSDMRSDLKDYRHEAVSANIKLDEHIRSCDRRYAELRHNPTGTPSPDWIERLPWPLRKAAERAIDYAVVSVVVLIIFAFKHGAHLAPINP